MNDFDIIRGDGRLLYEYIRGSHLYGLNNEDSDVDTSGVFMCTRNELLGCMGYHGQVSDTRNHKFEYDEIIAMLEQEKDRMNHLMQHSTLPQAIDTALVNRLLIEIRTRQLGLG